MTEEGSYIVSGWNMDKDDNLWVSRATGGNKKIASGEEAVMIHDELCRIATSSFPCLMHYNGNVITNIREGAEG
jgi:hypothetical protein